MFSRESSSGIIKTCPFSCSSRAVLVPFSSPETAATLTDSKRMAVSKDENSYGPVVSSFDGEYFVVI